MERVKTKTLAEIYIQQGHFKEAFQILKTLSEQDPTDIEVRKRLEEVTQKLDLPSSLAVEERISTLKEWLAAIQARRKK